MAGRIPKEFSSFVVEDSVLHNVLQEERVGRDDEVESVGNESMKVNMNANASDVVSLDDNISQIDPGNFSESDIDEDSGGSNCCHSFTDVLGGFPESDIEDGEDEMSECLSDAGISFNSDLGSPMHSSCRSYPVSEDRDEREESTPLPLYTAGPSTTGNTTQSPSHARSVDYETYNESEVSGQLGTGVKDDGGEFTSYSRRLRGSTRNKRKLSKAQTQPSTHYPKRNPRMAKKSEKSVKRSTTFGGESPVQDSHYYLRIPFPLIGIMKSKSLIESGRNCFCFYY